VIARTAVVTPPRRGRRDAVWSFCLRMAISMMARQGHCPPDRFAGE
jgi:hypothetical protein